MCPPGHYADTSGATACQLCAAGHWCSSSTQVECSENTYNSDVGAFLVTNCTRCPVHTTTLGRSGATSTDFCYCSSDYFRAPIDLIPQFSTVTSCESRCCTCPIGTDCDDGGNTLEGLPILPGYYRLNESGIDVRRCPDAEANCPEGESTCANTTSACSGGRNFTLRCRPGLRGVFCRHCVDDTSYYFHEAKAGVYASCTPCSEAMSRGMSSILGVTIIMISVTAMLLALASRFERGGRLRRLQTSCVAFISHYHIYAKLKVLIGFYMIVTKVSQRSS